MQVNLGHIHIHRMFQHPKHNIKTLNSSVTTGNFFKKEHFLQYSSIAIPIEQSRCLHLRHEKSIIGEEKSLNGVVYVLGTSRTKIENAA